VRCWLPAAFAFEAQVVCKSVATPLQEIKPAGTPLIAGRGGIRQLAIFHHHHAERVQMLLQVGRQ
jgi:hypothetical protein